jgi:hypothetical protein
MQANTQPKRADERWENPGVEITPSTDVATFAATTTLLFLGTLVEIAPEFVDFETLATRLTFAPTEFIKPASGLTTGEHVQLWSYGGTYLDTPQGRVPYRPSEIAEFLQVGKTYFVPATRRAGRLWLSSIAAVVLVQGESAIAPMRPAQNWIDTIVARSASSRGQTGTSNRAEAFLNAIRQAVNKP